jgi:small subunit ribosomal protein S5
VAKQKVSDLNLKDKIVYVGRTAKVVKGGRRFNFSAMVVVGDEQGHVGYGLGKAGEVSNAVTKATDSAKKSVVKVRVENGTIPHEVIGRFGAAKVLFLNWPVLRTFLRSRKVRRILTILSKQRWMH